MRVFLMGATGTIGSAVLRELVDRSERDPRRLDGWARGYACDQPLSGDKARRELGWSPINGFP